jgi:hypothetical protein
LILTNMTYKTTHELAQLLLAQPDVTAIIAEPTPGSFGDRPDGLRPMPVALSYTTVEDKLVCLFDVDAAQRKILDANLYTKYSSAVDPGVNDPMGDPNGQPTVGT